MNLFRWKCRKGDIRLSVSYVATVQYDLPEARYLRAEVKPKCNEDIPFSIDKARWELYYKNDDGEDILEASGECTVKEHEISAYIQPKNEGTYRFKYIYEIAGEIWVDNIKIKAG